VCFCTAWPNPSSEAENWSGRIEFQSALDGRVVNVGVPSCTVESRSNSPSEFTGKRLLHAQAFAGVHKKKRPLQDRMCSTDTDQALMKVEIFDLFFSLLLGVPVLLLQLADQFILLAGDNIDFVVGQLAPLFSDFPFELLPLTL
jgi:hypothetical protein